MLKYTNFILENKKTSNSDGSKKFDFIYSQYFGATIDAFKIDTISRDLIKSYGDMKSKYTYIDVTEQDDIVSYLHGDIAKTINVDEEDVWNYPNRQEMKIGRLINKIFPDKYSAEELEDFVNQYKSVMRESKTFFKLFSGDEIKRWYNEENVQEGGTLGNSCMRYDRCDQYLDLYTNNPQKIKLLVLFDKDSTKIIGRSLLWYLDSHNHTMMDRIYTTHDSDKNLFKRYAINNDISLSSFDDEFGGLEGIYTILKHQIYDKYPYLDTLNIYQPDTGILTDTIRNIKQGYDVYILDDIYGSAREHVMKT